MKRSFAKMFTWIGVLAAAASGQTPNFIAPAAYPTGGSSAQLVVADFNGDGLRDMATYESATQSLSILFGKADGTFQPPVSRGLGFSIGSMVAADFNGDGKADLALSTGGAIAILLNAGDGSFGPAAFYSTGLINNYVTAGDLNHDGFSDLIVAGYDGYAVLRGVGTGAFTAPMVLPGTFGHFWVGVADFNGDGNLDLMGDGSPGQFYAGNGDGTFAAPVATASIPYGAVVGDFNGDGKLDVAYLITTFNQERLAGQQVTLLIGTGTGQLLDAVDMFFNGAGTGQVAAGDFTGHGRTDLAIWLPASAQLFVLPNGSLQLSAVTADLSAVGNATLRSGDIDGNGSADLLLLNASAVTVLRNTHGNPPLLALASVTPSVIGGTLAQGTLTLGGPAPAGGATVSLAISNPSLAFPLSSSVTIPAGSSTANFSISTAAVLNSTPVTVTATYNSVSQAVNLTLVAPYSLSAVSVSPASQFGGFTTVGTVTLSGPADSGAIVNLSASNPALASVPASVTVPSGATSANFPITLQPVASDTAVSISASMAGISQTAAVTVLHPLDSVRITKAEDTLRSSQLKVEASSTSTSATLTVWNAGTGALIGTLANAGGGKYTGTFTVFLAVPSITVKSSLGGLITGAVVQK
jgi:hypothetical protein